MNANSLLLTPDTASATQRTTLFASNQNTPFDWEEFWRATVTAVRVPPGSYSEAYQMMLASEQVLRGDWEHPEEEAAWADL
jgi:hypothetical protein